MSEVSFLILSCIGQRFWVLCKCQVIIEATVPIFFVQIKRMQTRVKKISYLIIKDVVCLGLKKIHAM